MAFDSRNDKEWNRQIEYIRKKIEQEEQEGILFTIDCLNNHKYNFDYNLEELIKEAKKLQSNWNSLREWLENNEDDTFTAKVIYDVVLDKMNELEGEKDGIMD